VSPRPRPGTGFYPLVVSDVEPLTDDSAAISFTVPRELAGTFAFAAGQSLTIRRGDQRRSYSICAPAGAPPRIGVREVPGGAVSGWLVRQVKAGDTLEVQAPGGRFTPDLSQPGQPVLQPRVDHQGRRDHARGEDTRMEMPWPGWVRNHDRGHADR
jgi:ring-1,2-phenylacetyl-CoA epoxidase subunit PaaE